MEIVKKDKSIQLIAISDMQEWYKSFIDFSKSILKKDIDYGEIAGSKPSLLKPGAEKLRFAYSLQTEMENVDKTVDLDNGFVSYTYKCTVKDKSQNILSQCEGSVNSYEDKYLYRWQTTEKPEEQIANEMIANKQARWLKVKGAWVFQTRQKVGKEQSIANQNTIQKMAQKRAFVGAILLATGASEFFTQDIEDLDIVDIPHEVVDKKDASPAIPKQTTQPEIKKGDGKQQPPTKTVTSQGQKPWLNPGTKEWDNAFQKIHSGQIDMDDVMVHYRISNANHTNLLNPKFKYDANDTAIPS